MRRYWIVYIQEVENTPAYGKWMAEFRYKSDAVKYAIALGKNFWIRIGEVI